MKQMQTQLRQQTFTEFEQYADAAQGWSLELKKLDATPFSGEIFQLFFPDLVIGRGRTTGKFRQQGASPEGVRTFALLAESHHEMVWRWQPVNGSQFVAFPDGGELCAVTDEIFDVYTVSVPEELLFRRASGLGINGLEERLDHKEVLRGNELQTGLLRQSLRQISESDAITDPGSIRELVQTLLVGALAGDSDERIQMSDRRRRAVQLSERIILNRRQNPPTVLELCELTGVSQRTLEYAFHEYFGVSPKAYINALRLNGARRERRAGRCVADAAGAWGFWHMGQFAKDYRRLFRELPSQTG